MSQFRAVCLVPLLSVGLAFATERVAHETERSSIKHWDAPAISSPNWESHPAFDPRTGDLWFVRSDPKFSGWHLLVRAVATEHGWRREQPFPEQNGSEIGPLISPDSGSFMFSRDAGDGAAGELFISQVSAGVGWTPKCPRHPSGR